ncbi:Peptidase propeptide and YPEB domain-containing protein [Modicisalibacter ilicicola DSM 19980]|uniref:Peptidase propeptide and YPEB domain-containing protein n=1 Tax=Modicisalibacter ilicicola DSM 19980 TaxID=1121942 RepID=A0A1M5CWG3_9GAMM|nr:PepSY domain-containing protein [Halomonas ilicicola]SHF59054.1 Peptidase propeptide and YPEB domain-containing protein [Halomonas ilicicola DSM 19980]
MTHSKLIGFMTTVVGTGALLSAGWLFAANDTPQASSSEQSSMAADAGIDMTTLVQRVEREQGGRVVEVEREDGYYEVKLVDDEGRTRELYFDERGERREDDDDD